MTQAVHVHGCNHGFLPGQCPAKHCENSANAKRLAPPVVELVPEPEPPDPEPEPDPEPPPPAARRVQRRQTRNRPSGSLCKRARRLASIVAEEYDIPLDDLLSADRHKQVSEARQVLYFVCRNCTDPVWSFPEIGASIGRDHSTVMHALKVIARRMERDVRLATRVQRLVALGRKIDGGPSMSLTVLLSEIPDLEGGA